MDTLLAFTIILLIGAFCAGLLGSLTGLGGGVVVIPLLTLALGVDFHYAIGAALIASIATSSGAAVAYVREGFTNLRLGMFLEVATALGAMAGTLIALWLPINTIAIIFGLMLLFTAVMTCRVSTDSLTTGSRLAQRLRLNSDYPTATGRIAYRLTGVVGGWLLMIVAGVLSGLLGIGSGVLKVLAMDTVMKAPFKVSTTTSNFMIGVTAATGAIVYIQRGYIVPLIGFPVMIGVLGGAMLGARLLPRMKVVWLRRICAAAILGVAGNMIYNGFIGHF
jgi:uncharacterized membrane protein YfcA